MKVSEILSEQFKDEEGVIRLPHWKEFVRYICSEEWHEGFMETNKWVDNDIEEYSLYLLDKFANKLDESLELDMFVRCDKNGNVLEEPEGYKQYLKYGDFGTIKGYQLHKCKQYHEAKERVLFEGFEVAVTDNGDVYFSNIYYWCGENKCMFDKQDNELKTISDMIGQPIKEQIFKLIG